MKRPSPTFCNEKHIVLGDFYYKFLAYYILENKSYKACKYQPDKVDDSLTESNHEECF